MSNATIKSTIKARYEAYTTKFNTAKDANDKLVETDIFGAYLDGASEILALTGGPDAEANEKVIDAARRFNKANADRIISEDNLLQVFE